MEAIRLPFLRLPEYWDDISVSLIIGAALNYLVLAPILIQRGAIIGILLILLETMVL